MRLHRSSGHRRLTARLPVLLLALAAALAALLLGSVGVGQAQTAVSLIEVQGGGTQISIRGERASPIETAASAGAAYDGWVVTEVELRIMPDFRTGADRTATPPGLAICESDADGSPLERYREEGRSWRTVSRPAGLLGWQTIAALRNGRAYEVRVASVNSVGAGAWAEARGVPQAPQAGAPPQQPQGDDALDVGSLGVWWVSADPNGKFWGNDRRMDSCAGTHPFTVGVDPRAGPLRLHLGRVVAAGGTLLLRESVVTQFG